MEELYQFIEEKIRKAGYPGMIDGREFYSDVSKEAEDRKLEHIFLLLRRVIPYFIRDVWKLWKSSLIFIMLISMIGIKYIM